MFTYKTLITRVVVSLLTAVVAGSFTYESAAQTVSPQLTFEPYCILTLKSLCKKFAVQDAKTLQTDTLKVGDILDIGIVLQSPTPQDISTVRSWIDYDPTVLEARDVELAPALPSALPGEQTIDAKNGIIKIGGGTQGKLTDTEATVARITFKVLSASKPTSIHFHHFLPDGSGETSVVKTVGTQTTSLLTVEPASLTVAVAGSLQSSLSSFSVSSSSVAATTQSSSANAGSSFALLQIQNLKATTKDTNIFIGWDALFSSQLAGYNVYYGNTSGRYIQRRSIPKSSSSLVLRDLEPNKQYFIAVRGYNAANEETTFSQEVGIVVGRPETSTSPLDQTAVSSSAAQLPIGNPIGTHGGQHITGETGMNDGIALICFLSAVIGTLFAARKQYTASSHS